MLVSESEFRSYRCSVGLDRVGEQEDEQRAAGEGEREHHSCHSGPEEEWPRALLFRGFKAPQCARRGHNQSVAGDNEKEEGL